MNIKSSARASLFLLPLMIGCGVLLPRTDGFTAQSESATGSSDAEDAAGNLETDLDDRDPPEDICEAYPNKLTDISGMWVYYGSTTPEYVPLTAAEQQAVVGLGFGANQPANCSGTLVKSEWVLTAQHCTNSTSANNTYVLFGPDDRNPDLRVQVAEVIAHPSHDMALLRLTQKPADSIDVTPIPVWTGDFSNSDPGRIMEQAGYGRTESGSGEGRRFVAEVLHGFEDNGNLHVVNGEGQHGVCFGDSGGPSMLVTDAGHVAVAGVLSWGDPSCVGYDRYARTDRFKSWIEQHMGPLEEELGPRSCDDLPETGRCDTNQERVYRCVDDVLEVEVCSQGTYCGFDASNNRWDCVTADEDACEGLTFQGECAANGDLAWCEEGVIRERPCGQCGERCAWQSALIGNACEEDPCQGITYEGYCNGETVVWCENGDTLRERDCAAQSESCRYLGEETGYACAPSCGGDLDYLGFCDGAVLKWCDRQGRSRERDCADRGERCDWVSDTVGYNCVD